jgi:hypothetical protein
MKRWGKLNPVRFDETELKTDLGKDNFIFVGSSCDMFAEDINSDWTLKTLEHCAKFDNKYLFQTKNPDAFTGYGSFLAPLDPAFCVTMETNRVYKEFMGNTPDPTTRAIDFEKIPIKEKYITIEPIMDFDFNAFYSIIKHVQPLQVNIGANSGNVKLPEPNKEKILQLISWLEEITTVKQKKNLNRLLK